MHKISMKEKSVGLPALFVLSSYANTLSRLKNLDAEIFRIYLLICCISRPSCFAASTLEGY